MVCLSSVQDGVYVSVFSINGKPFAKVTRRRNPRIARTEYEKGDHIHFGISPEEFKQNHAYVWSLSRKDPEDPSKEL